MDGKRARVKVFDVYERIKMCKRSEIQTQSSIVYVDVYRGKSQYRRKQGNKPGKAGKKKVVT